METMIDNYEITWVSDNCLQFKIKKRDGGDGPGNYLGETSSNDFFYPRLGHHSMDSTASSNEFNNHINPSQSSSESDEMLIDSRPTQITGTASQQSKKLYIDSSTFLGTRKENQDSYFHKIFENYNVKVIGVFDGHGDGDASTPTSNIICKYISNQFLNNQVEVNNTKYFSNCIINSLNKANEYLLQEKENDYGTTATLAIVTDQNKVITGWAGDSTAVLFRVQRDGVSYVAEPLTQDHKPENTLEKERILAAGGRVIYRYGSYRVLPKQGAFSIDEIKKKKLALNMSRALGHTVLSQFGVSPQPEISERSISVDDVLIVASDGLWNVFDFDTVSRLISKYFTTNGPSVKDLSNYLIDLVDTKCESINSQCDNVTICCYRHI